MLTSKDAKSPEIVLEDYFSEIFLIIFVLLYASTRVFKHVHEYNLYFVSLNSTEVHSTAMAKYIIKEEKNS